MSGRDIGGEAPAPAPRQPERAPLAPADEAQHDTGAVPIAAAAGRQRGDETRGAALTLDGARRSWGRA